MNKGEGKLDLIATKTVPEWEHLYKVVDFLNKNIKDKNIIIGLSKCRTENQMVVTIYETL